MGPELSAAELQAWTRREPGERLRAIVQGLREGEDVWTLADGEALMLFGDEESPPLLLVWPHEEFALLWAESAEVGDVELVGMEAASFVEVTLSELDANDVTLRMFPTPDDDGTDVSPRDLREQVRGAG